MKSTAEPFPAGECGSDLNEREKDALDRDGYLVFPDVIGPKWLEDLRAAFERAMREGPQTSDRKQTGTRHVANLASKDPAFEGVRTFPKVLAAARQILKRPFRVSQLSGRDPLPGFGQQGLHIDWYQRSGSEPFSIVTTIWLLDDFTERNGATRLVPGSHFVPTPLPKSMQEPANRHPNQKIITASAGSVLVFNGHVYHSGTRNDSNAPRRVLQCLFLAN